MAQVVALPSARAQLPGARTPVGLPQHPELVLGGEPAPCRALRHLGVGRRARGHDLQGGAAAAERPFGASGASSLLTALGRRGRLVFFGLAMTETPLSALYSNSRGGRCLTIVGTEGSTAFRGLLKSRVDLVS
jgi:hypothetical protein